MPIMIAPRAGQPLTELDHTQIFPVEPNFARLLVAQMALGTDATGKLLYKGTIWDQPEEDLAYPGSPFDVIQMPQGLMVRCPVLFAKGLLIAWAQQVMTEEMIVQVPMRARA